ncbi:MAG TPA: hypothetical protein VHC72_20185, partial [Bryobacteraceae bacterium]|nr:hypothetical protein [Bryobacteraceae bacterium]
MRRWIEWAARLYPRSWRAEFGEEFRAVLDDVKPSWRVFGNVLRGAIEMRVAGGSNWAKVVAAMALAGAVVGFGVSFQVAPAYQSSATVSFTPVADPVRPASAEVRRERTSQHVREMETEILSRAVLSSIIQDSRLLLYQTEKPSEDVIDKMRSHIRMTMAPSADGDPASVAIRVSFSCSDAAKARATVDALVFRLIEANQNRNWTRNRNYQDFWQRMAAVEHLQSVPPAPVGDFASVLTAASTPVKAGPNRLVFIAWGLGIGALLGFAGGVTVRWPAHARRIAGFAMAGCLLAGAASFLIPNRYISTAVMEIGPAELTEDPLASAPAPVSAAAFLGQV